MICWRDLRQREVWELYYRDAAGQDAFDGATEGGTLAFLILKRK